MKVDKITPPESAEVVTDAPLSQAQRGGLDQHWRAGFAPWTGGLSPAALRVIVDDWALHLAASPSKQADLWQLAFEGAADYGRYLFEAALGQQEPQPCVESSPKDRRFHHEGWKTQPFNAMQQAFLLQQNWWQAATTGVRGVSKDNERAMSFVMRQMLDCLSPANFALTNPEVIETTRAEGGENLRRGFENMAEDVAARLSGAPHHAAPDLVPGKALATTPGKVVYRNHLIELIQYAPATETTHPEPILIVPAWIMKYYILDLSPENSMVRYLTAQGFTVFMISWRNPDAGDAHLSLEDYRQQGPMAALQAIEDITGAKKIHAAGYCLGGTLLGIAAATMAREGDARLASMTLFAAQTDFTEAGEIMLFIGESQVAFLEDMMQEQGFLEAGQMSGAFQLLRSNDLIWSRMKREYLMGVRTSPSDLMAWNADDTRMPARMHSEYLRKLFLENQLAFGKYRVDGHPVSLHDIHAPIFAVGTETDHVAPWPSVYKIETLTRAPVTFVLTKGGHNAGVISEPGHPRRHYRVRLTGPDDPYLAPEDWVGAATLKQGSWWPEWCAWLAARSGARAAPPAMGAALCDAPGTYVFMD